MLNHEEQISSLMDGELSGTDMFRVLDRMSSSPEAREKWTRYHLLRHLLREERYPMALDAGLAERVSRNVENEPHWLLPPNSRHSFREAPAVRWVAAASVAILVVFAAQGLWFQGGAPGEEPPLWVNSAEGSSEAQLHAEAEERLRDYLIMHNESIQVAGDDDTLASTRKVSYAP